MALHLWSSDLVNGGDLPLRHVMNGFGHSGANLSPHLCWEGVPDGTKSLVVSMFDMDAPTGSGFWHWVVVDLAPGSRELLRGAGTGQAALPTGARQTLNDASQNGYVGAAPPPGRKHRYAFMIRALSISKLPVADQATGAMVGLIAGPHELDRATLMVTYGG